MALICFKCIFHQKTITVFKVIKLRKKLINIFFQNVLQTILYVQKLLIHNFASGVYKRKGSGYRFNHK